MLTLENRFLRLDLLDPAAAADAPRQGTRYCWGGYVWQVHDATLGPLLSGPEFPHAAPSPFNGQGVPESFRHRTRDGRPLTWRGREALAVGIGSLALDQNNEVTLTQPCDWTVTRSSDRLVFQTRQSAAGFSTELTREIELRDRTVRSRTQLTNAGATPLALQWFAHPFWPLTGGRAIVRLPAGSTLSANPGFELTAVGTLSFSRPFVSADDSQFALLTLPAGQVLRLEVNHPHLPRVTFTTDFVPDECPVWANAHTLSVEPYLTLELAPGETRHWHLVHGFGI